MTRRIIVNLIVFCLLGVVLILWALKNVLTLDFLSQPYEISAEFTSSPGLQPNFDVAYLGVTVGKIESVKLGDHKIIAKLKIDKGEKIPGNVTAAAGHQSAIGEPYVDLELPSGQTGTAPLRSGAVIPVSRTSVSVSYGDLFAAVNNAVSGLNAQDLSTVTHELGEGWDGRAGSLQQLLDSSNQITSTFAANTQLLDSLVRQLATTTTTLAQHGDEFGAGLDGITQFADALASSNTALKTIRDKAPGLLNTFNKVLAATQAQNECSLAALGGALPAILNRQALSSLSYTEAHAKTQAATLLEISPMVNGKSNLNIDFVMTLRSPKPALEYKTPKPLPDVGKIPACKGVQLPSSSTGTAAGATAKASPGTTGKNDTTMSARSATKSDDATSTLKWLVYIPPLIALAVLIRMMGRAVPVLRRRRSRRDGE